METAILKLKPNSQFHLGKVGLDENMSLNSTSEFIHSDTLFSAMINIISSVVGNDINEQTGNQFIEDFISETEKEINFSSVFYMLSINNKSEDVQNDIFFLPKPVNSGVSEKENYKEIKKIKFVSKRILEKGTPSKDWINESECSILDGKFVCLKEELCNFEEYKQIKLYTVETNPKVRVRTKKITDNLYNQSTLMIADNKFIMSKGDFTIDINFYFLYDISKASETNKKLFRLFLNLLPEIGIGGQRSTGCGFVESISDSPGFSFLPKRKDKDASRFLLLSLFVPANEDEYRSFEYYNFISRGGRNAGTDKKELKRIKMLTEGSIANSESIGKIEDISPKNSSKKYLRNGRGFFIEL
ncbi:MAG: type III-A CRISPR-associated RAMP protein Csm4 [Bacteroidetes bacterium]|jgi:CRISPR-associated protein Csm4|nr:type III-A CRISPR-associated RAMP protein Csm4 [Bacteroidota bacterium]MBT6686029.1 type III-A CRISPR-associated RAMP protein Csm4 [Bacteroidota bacterium]MBT7144538.1 type III-A CRISPR-associated RAMP protein Csm4 [Bacteroidota bacterium]MBT7492699.1 type III-A CRISPR-associated RAMP protein Csm4 [Bacteroidota bacterium]